MNAIATISLSSLRPAAPRAKAPAALGTARLAVADVEALFALPFMDLMFRTQQVHRRTSTPTKRGRDRAR